MSPPPNVRERTFVASPTVDAGNRVIASPFQFGVDGSDNLRVTVWNQFLNLNAAAEPVITVQGRFLTDAGEIEPLSVSFSALHTDAPLVRLIPLGVGWVQNLTCFVGQGYPQMGQVFVRVEIVRGLTGAVIALGTILQGYITNGQGLSWPGSPIQHTTDIDGWIAYLTSDVPPVGSAVTFTMSSMLQAEVMSAKLQYDTSATVITRRPRVDFVNNTITQIRVLSQDSQGASASNLYYWAQGLTGNVPVIPGFSITALPTGPTLQPADQLVITANNLQAGDAFFLVKVQVMFRMEIL